LSEKGIIHTIDCNEELISIQERYFNQSPYASKVKRHHGYALELIPKLKGPFDLVFIDADKENYENYFELILPKMRKGGLLLSDNVMWSGKVLHPADPKDQATAILKKYNKKLSEDPRIQSVLLPLRDGITLSRVL
ncbi:MAG: methyltransferase, partial [Flavobacteriia bacterium]|nr:methyltransferase [Flavobacteriia bacterium]